MTEKLKLTSFIRLRYDTLLYIDSLILPTNLGNKYEMKTTKTALVKNGRYHFQ